MDTTSLMLGLGLLVAGTAQAQEIFVNSDITTSTTWTANNTYNLQRQIYVRNGATLTIEPGALIASTTGLGGSLAVAAGSQIIANGTAEEPIIFTSKADVATWTGGDPTTGRWRESANEWGNLTIMGNAFISENADPSNRPSPNANNKAIMEGLVTGPRTYGGGNDNDDSGTLAFVSIRYGGRVINLNNELNGLSLGGIGRGTDIHHVEIMNNVDDGIEIWGGTVNLSHISIWNIGDDSLDIDQGWRGKAQFGLIVQGYSVDASQGSGVGDNMIEHDGAEDSDWQPRTRGRIENFTCIGNTGEGDGATAWRDNCGMQYYRCIFMDCPEKVVRFDNDDGDGANGYGHNGTRTWAQHWTTPAANFPRVNAPANPGGFYTAQNRLDRICDIEDSVFYNNGDYAEADARGVFAADNNNVKEPAARPIFQVRRGARVTKGGKLVDPVVTLKPWPVGAARTSVEAGLNDPTGFFQRVRYRGAFAPNSTWLPGWTASTAFGLTPDDDWYSYGNGSLGVRGNPVTYGTGATDGGNTVTIGLEKGPSNSAAFLAISPAPANTPLFNGATLNVDAINFGVIVGAGTTNAAGNLTTPLPWPNAPAGRSFYFQHLCFDTTASGLLSVANAVRGTTN